MSKNKKDRQNESAPAPRDERENIEREEEYDPDIYTLTGEEGEELQFYLLGTLEDRGMVYKAFLPVGSDDDEYVILRYDVDENGDEFVETIEDDDEFDRVSDIFNDELSDILYDDDSEK